MREEILSYLNEKYNYNLSIAFYNKIAVWRNWWQGFYKPFHHYQISNGQCMVYRDMFTLDMGKKVCEDWASILLNDKTAIVLDDQTASVFLQGDDQNGGVFGSNKFWKQANALIEKAFWSGTGAVVQRIMNLKVNAQGQPIPSDSCQIKLTYVAADCIIPLSYENDEITEAAFCSDVTVKGKKFLYLELHLLDESGNYVITNTFFKRENNILKEAEVPPNTVQSWSTGSPIPQFSIVKPNIVNNLDQEAYPKCGLGLSILENAMDNLKGIDLAYNNLNCDFKLGGKKVFMSEDLLGKTDEGKTVTPDDTGQQLFSYVAGSMMEGASLIQEHNPTIRVAENTQGIQAQLDYLSFKVGFGTKHYQFNSSSIVTATQYAGDKQDLIQNANKHYINVESFLIQLVRAILWAGKACINPKINADAKVTIQFDDSIIIDKETERARDKEDVRDNIMAKWEFRSKWYGEDEETAKTAIAEMEDPASDDDSLLGFETEGGGG